MAYVDPNSGAAPQPGGFAGFEGGAKGFALSPELELEEEPQVSQYEPSFPASNGTIEVPEEDTELNDFARAVSDPKAVLAELDEGDSPEEPESDESDDESDEDDSDEEDESDDEESDDSDDQEDEEAYDAYDPSDYNVQQVLDFVEAHPDQKDGILASEKAGKNRSTIVTALS